MAALRVKQAWPVAAITVVSLFLYSAIAVLRWWHFDLDSYDLSIYHQVIWHLSRFQAPAVTVVGEANYFGDHFSPILMLFAPAYWLVSSPVALLIGQALLIAASIPAVYLYARRRMPEFAAVLLCLAYAQSWGVWAAIDSAVHEVAFAAPLLAWGICLADARRWIPAYACFAALLLVKEDLGLVVAAFGVVLALRGERWRGCAVAVAALAGFVLVNEVLMPAFGPGGWSLRDAKLYGAYGDSAGSALTHLARHPGVAVAAMTDDPQKLRLVTLLLAAFAGLSLLSPLVLLVVPQVVERLLANDPNLWGPSYQYSLVPMVILALAAADGISLLTRSQRVPRVVPAVLAVCSALIAVVSAAVFPLSRLVHPGYWNASRADDQTRTALSVVPDDAGVAADWSSLAHLSPRAGMFVPGQIAARRPRYVVLRGDQLPGALRHAYELVRQVGPASVYRKTGRAQNAFDTRTHDSS